jgi:predicted ATP-grasp superfamily ATP-dependent carboligase
LWWFRYTVSAGLLISTILFHVNSVMKATSHTSHLSYFDLMMVVTYVVNAVTVQFNVAIFLIDRWITRFDLKHNTEAFRSLQHKHYVQSVNDAVRYFVARILPSLQSTVRMYPFTL